MNFDPSIGLTSEVHIFTKTTCLGFVFHFLTDNYGTEIFGYYWFSFEDGVKSYRT